MKSGNMEKYARWVPLLNHFRQRATLAQALATGTPILITNADGSRRQATPFEVQNFWLNQWFLHVCIGITLVMISQICCLFMLIGLLSRIGKAIP